MRDLQAIIDGLADRLHRAVAVDDPHIRLLAHTAHHEQVDTHRVHSIMTLSTSPEIEAYVHRFGIKAANGPVRIPKDEGLDILARVCLPIRTQGVLQGYLWLIDDDESLTDEQLQDAQDTADEAGEVLFRNHLLDDLRRAKERELLLDMVSSESHLRGHITEEMLSTHGIRPQMSCNVLVVMVLGGASRDATSASLLVESSLRKAIRNLPRVHSLVATREGGLAYALFAFESFENPVARIRAFGADVRSEVAAGLPPGTDVRVGIGPTQAAVSGAPLSLRRALSVLDVVQAVPEFDPVTSWDDLGVYQVLNQFPPDELAEVAIPAGLRALFTVNADQWLVDTLDAYLDAAGNVQETSKRLQIHRATLYYRLSRIEEITGASLGDGRDRLALHLGIKLARLLGELPSAAG